MQNQVYLSYKQTLAFRALTEKNDIEELFMGGAAGPGKTWLGCLWQIYNRINFPDTRGLIGRLTRKQLYDTTIETFSKVAKDIFNLKESIDYVHNQKLSRITFSNGSFIYLAELRRMPSDRDFHRFGSMEITDAFIDEAPEITEAALDIISSRVRYNLINDQPKVLCCGNPANNWAKLRWISDEQGQTVKLKKHQLVVRALLRDNPDPEFRKTYRANLMKLPIYQRARLLDGNWDVVENDQPFFASFDRIKHITSDLIFDNIDPLWISFDFNVTPTVCIVAQKTSRGCMIAAEHLVEGGTEKLCQQLKRYKDRAGAIYVTGDFSGNTRHTSAKNTDYQIIAKELMLPKNFFKNTTSANKDHVFSRNLCDYFITHVAPQVDNKCVNLISDLQNAQATDDGKLRKDRELFKMDIADAFRYLVDAWFPRGIKDIDAYLFTMKRD